MELFDTHCHLDSYPSLELEPLIFRAREKGVKKILTIGTDLESSRAGFKIASRWENIFFSAGYHPHQAKDFKPKDLKELKKLAKKEKCLAIGETGLDYYYLHSAKDIQKEVFRQQIELACELGRPLIIHSRQAFEEVMEILLDFPSLSFVFHCFSGTHQEFLKIRKAGGLVSFTGIVTFKKAQELKEVAKEAPLESFFLETDSPYLSPEPFRGKKNEPAYLTCILQFLAQLREESEEKIALETTKNADRFFRLDLLP